MDQIALGLIEQWRRMYTRSLVNANFGFDRLSEIAGHVVWRFPCRSSDSSFLCQIVGQFEFTKNIILSWATKPFSSKGLFFNLQGVTD